MQTTCFLGPPLAATAARWRPTATAVWGWGGRGLEDRRRRGILEPLVRGAPGKGREVCVISAGVSLSDKITRISGVRRS